MDYFLNLRIENDSNNRILMIYGRKKNIQVKEDEDK